MATKKKKKKKAVRRSRSAPDERYIIALGADRKTIYVAAEATRFSDPVLWKKLNSAKGAATKVVARTLVAPSPNRMIALLGGNLTPSGNLNPLGGVVPKPPHK